MRGEPKSLWIWLLRLVVAVLLIRQLAWLCFGVFNEDEFENLQVLWLLDHGMRFGRDFVTSHLPAFSLLLWPVYRWMGAGTALPGATRLVLLPFMVVTVCLIHRIAKRGWGNDAGGWLALALVLSSPTLAASLVESRPDAVALPLALFGLLSFGCHVDRRAGTKLFLTAGLCFGLSSLMNPKAVFLTLATAWAGERHHHLDLSLPARERWRRIGWFLVAAAAPFTGVVGGLQAAGWITPSDVEVFLTTGYAWLDPVHFAPYKAFLLERIVGLAPLPWFLGLASLVPGWGGQTHDRDPLGEAVSITALAELAHLAATSVLVTQLLVLPCIVLAAAAARGLRRWPAPAVCAVALASAVGGATFGAEDRSGRDDQLARLAFVLEHVPEDRAVLDGRFGTEAFRPLVGRFQQYRPWVYRPAVFAREEARVIGAIATRRVGAVVHHPLSSYIRPEIQSLIERNYAPSARPDVWLPRPREARPAAPDPR